jgi:hypothetical protein
VAATSREAEACPLATAGLIGAAVTSVVPVGVAELLTADAGATIDSTGSVGVTEAVVTGLAVVVVGGYLGGLVAALSVDDLAPVHAGPLALAMIAGPLLFLALGGVTLLVASLVRTGGRAVGWATGFLLVSYALDYLAQVWSVAEPLGPLSVFHYLDPPAILRRGTIGAEDVLALGGLAVVTTALAHALIGRRDLTP